MKKVISIILVCSCALFALAACSSGGASASNAQSSSSSEPPAKITNEEYISAVAQGLEARWVYSDAEYTVVSKKAIEDYRGRVQCEQDAIAQFEGREFEDKALAEKAAIYKKSLEDCQEACNAGDVSPNLFQEKWQAAYQVRAGVIADFVNEYGLKVSDEFKYYMEDVLSSVPHLSFVDQSVGEHDFGYIFSNITVRNDGSEPINNASVSIHELDANGNITNTTYAGDPTVVQPGQSVTLRGMHPETVTSIQVVGFSYFNGTTSSGTYVSGVFEDLPVLSLQ